MLDVPVPVGCGRTNHCGVGAGGGGWGGAHVHRWASHTGRAGPNAAVVAVSIRAHTTTFLEYLPADSELRGDAVSCEWCDRLRYCSFVYLCGGLCGFEIWWYK